MLRVLFCFLIHFGSLTGEFSKLNFKAVFFETSHPALRRRQGTIWEESDNLVARQSVGGQQHGQVTALVGTSGHWQSGKILPQEYVDLVVNAARPHTATHAVQVLDSVAQH